MINPNLLLKLTGRSGCRIDLVQEADHVIVRKHSSNTAYNNRLLKQAEKQAKFPTHVTLEFIRTPKVLNTYPASADSLASFEMEYVHADKYSDYLERASIQDIHSLTTKFISYFEYMIRASEVAEPDKAVLEKKRMEVTAKALTVSGIDRALVQAIDKKLQQIPSGKLYLGHCHGDFTLSNILFTEDSLVLIDFLDSFVESPIQDIVKLRQDTCFAWTLMIDANLGPASYNKMIQIFNHFDREIEKFVLNNPIVTNWYDYFQVFNLYRILPYLSEAGEIQFVQSKLRTLI